MLKAILKVKTGTTSDLVYKELDRPDIISRIKYRQYNFFSKLSATNATDALVKSFLALCDETSVVTYYKSLDNHHRQNNIQDRKNRILTSSNSMMIRYRSLINMNIKSIIYNSYMEDEQRSVISRWRLSNHQLRIETGRYDSPKTPRENRKCLLCNVV